MGIANPVRWNREAIFKQGEAAADEDRGRDRPIWEAKLTVPGKRHEMFETNRIAIVSMARSAVLAWRFVKGGGPVIFIRARVSGAGFVKETLAASERP